MASFNNTSLGIVDVTGCLYTGFLEGVVKVLTDSFPLFLEPCSAKAFLLITCVDDKIKTIRMILKKVKLEIFERK
jgi:hypothetical protein